MAFAIIQNNNVAHTTTKEILESCVPEANIKKQHNIGCLCL